MAPLSPASPRFPPPFSPPSFHTNSFKGLNSFSEVSWDGSHLNSDLGCISHGSLEFRFKSCNLPVVCIETDAFGGSKKGNGGNPVCTVGVPLRVLVLSLGSKAHWKAARHIRGVAMVLSTCSEPNPIPTPSEKTKLLHLLSWCLF